MFGRRKEKEKEEDDPLVPHGLIWQATDEEGQTAQSDPRLLKSSAEVVGTPFPAEKPPAISVVPPSRVSNAEPPPLTPAADATPPRLGAISPPIRWPSPKSASVIRRVPPPTTPPVLTSATAPNLAEPQNQPQPLLHHAPSPPPRNEVEIVDLTTTAPAGESSRQRKTMAQVLQLLDRLVGMIGSVISGWLEQARGTARELYQSLNLGSCQEHLKLAKEKCVATLSSQSRFAGRWFQPWWRSNLSRMARMKPAIGRFASEMSRSAVARSAKWRRIRNHKLRIRIVKLGNAQELIKRSRLAWAQREQAMRREPRLWMSMTMAALSALLTLGVISAVSHYAPGADASNKAVGNRSTNNSGVINPKIVVGPRTPGTTSEASGSTRSIPSAQAKPSSAQKNNASRRAHRNPNGDYVAPDTYHYYGMNHGKSR